MNQKHKKHRDDKKEKSRERELLIYMWLLQHAGENSSRETEMQPWGEQRSAS